MGKGVQKFGALYDRESAKEDLYKGLEFLATWRGNAALDKKDVPGFVEGALSPSHLH